jgi:hypothetical protein
MPTTTASPINRVLKGQYKGYYARVIEKGKKDQIRCELTNYSNDLQAVDWVPSASLKEVEKLKIGEILSIFDDRGEHTGSFAEVIQHDPVDDFYKGKAYCNVISPSGNRNKKWVEDRLLRPTKKQTVEARGIKAIASVTASGMRFDIKGQDPIQSTKFVKDQAEAQALLDKLLEVEDEIAPFQGAGAESLQEPEATNEVSMPELISEITDFVEELLPEEPLEELEEDFLEYPEIEGELGLEERFLEDFLDDPEEDREEDDFAPIEVIFTPSEPEPAKSNLLQFTPRSPVVSKLEVTEIVAQPAIEATVPETEGEESDGTSDSDHPKLDGSITEEEGEEGEDWTFLTSEHERKCRAIAVKLIEISQPFSEAVTDYLWELKFVVFQNDNRRKSQEYGTFEQMCRRLHDEEGFPYRPNSAREKANAEQERRELLPLVDQDIQVKVKGMSDAAALELRRMDTFRDAEEEEILEAKKLVIESAPELTKKAISETIKSVSTEENWEDKYKFRFNPKPRKQTGEKPEKISREEVENVQNLNTLLRLQVSELQAENEELRKENENKILNEQFLSEQAQAIEAQLAQKEREIEQLKQELEEARQMRAIAG